KPVGEVAVDPNQPKPAAVAAAPAATAAVPIPAPAAKSAGGGKADASKGKSVYDATCHVCHAAGVSGAPKAGDKAAWAPRLKAGKSTLYASSLKGKGAMPPKGGNLSLADADVQAAVDYMVGLVK
ncbi:MAG TPA: c-type cytochrome, partial [Burkholderiales bacterium]|nr:c-type cytochrome [Burkholderiales bacterium]